MISRRRFLQLGCLSTTALGLTGCGVTAIAPDPPPVDFNSVSFGGKRMDTRVLIAYASFAGTTKEVSDAIAQTLSARGHAVDVISVSENPQVGNYQ